MTKKILTSIVSFVIAAMPVVSGVHADSGSFEPIQADQAWSYADYRVERLAFSSKAVGPIAIGPAVLVAEPTDSVGVFHVSFLKNGMKLNWTNVSLAALESQKVMKNGNRLVYTQTVDLNQPTYALVERDLSTGQGITLVKEAFFQSPTSLGVMVDGSTIIFNPTYKASATGFSQAGTEVWSEAEQKANVINPHWYMHTLRQEVLQDVRGTQALIKMNFERGEKELWFMNTKDADGNMSNSSVPGTWTEPHNDIVAAHFRSNGSIEFFMNFVRYTYDPKTDANVVRHEGEFLNWFRAVSDANQLAGDRMAWVNPEDRLFVSDLSGVTEIGTATEGRFHLESDRIFYASGAGGAVYDFATKTTKTLPFGVTDTVGDIAVGQDSMNQIWYMNLKTDQGLKLGYGSTPTISDEAHVYWKGIDGGIYEATISSAKKLSLNPVRAFRAIGDSQVWLVKDQARYGISDEAVYFSWFPSWASLETVNTTELERFPNAGSARFAPGAKVKTTDNRDVFVVGRDEKLHWVPSESIAYRLFGEFWNKNILQVKPGVLFDYMVGNDLQSEQDLAHI